MPKKGDLESIRILKYLIKIRLDLSFSLIVQSAEHDVANNPAKFWKSINGSKDLTGVGCRMSYNGVLLKTSGDKYIELLGRFLSEIL